MAGIQSKKKKFQKNKKEPSGMIEEKQSSLDKKSRVKIRSEKESASGTVNEQLWSSHFLFLGCSWN